MLHLHQLTFKQNTTTFLSSINHSLKKKLAPDPEKFNALDLYNKGVQIKQKTHRKQGHE